MDNIDKNIERNVQADTSVKDWIMALILVAIPLVNIIVICFWAFSDHTSKPSRKNWAIATIILFLFISIITAIFYFIFGIISLKGVFGVSPAGQEAQAFFIP